MPIRGKERVGEPEMKSPLVVFQGTGVAILTIWPLPQARFRASASSWRGGRTGGVRKKLRTRPITREAAWRLIMMKRTMGLTFAALAACVMLARGGLEHGTCAKRRG